MTGWQSFAFSVLGVVLFAVAMRRAEQAVVWPLQVAWVLVALFPMAALLALAIASRLAVVVVR
ncbi:hypothetical protein [Nocardioides nitrophenolicus]|uniref:hypothetical protein n=1 Tax=Nocardioides nitrophenolicus TaxID=60489 RepID=UPI000B2A42B6|nr:hypothetical protein [Nocardioides nitrophenolicus]MBM7518299.1 hypothetical protein [Nocardioides nitrophenolicus]